MSKCKEFKGCVLMSALVKFFITDIIELLDTYKIEYNLELPDNYINIPHEAISKKLLDTLTLSGLVGEGFIRCKLSTFIYKWVFEKCEE